MKTFIEKRIKINRMISSLALVLINIPNVSYCFSYDAAIYAAQKGDTQGADERLRTIVVNAPDNADVLYDAGEIAHRLNNVTQATAYFTRAAECASDDKQLCFRAHYNAGNAYVEAKDLHAALEQYDKALLLEPDNEYVRHNRDRVAQMLQDQKQDQQKQEQDQQKDDQQENDKDEQSGEQNDKQGEDKSEQKSSDEKSQGEQANESNGGGNGEQRKEHGDTQEQQKNSANNKKRNDKQGLDDKAKGAHDKKKKQESKQHGNTPDQQRDEASDKNSVPSGGGQEQEQSDSAILRQAQDERAGDTSSGTQALANDSWLARILDDQELKDKATNKQLMEAKVRQHGGKNGQNCW